MEFFFSNYFETVAFIFVDSMNYWWPFIGGFIVWKLYIYYIRAKWIKNNTYSLLEIKMPKNISKSPLAMEVVLSAMYQGSEGSLIDQYVKGRCRSSFSLEMISDSGNIRFFIRSEFKYKNIIESNIYSQYPGVEVFDRSGEDYAYRVSYGLPGSDWNLWGAEWKLTAGDATQ